MDLLAMTLQPTTAKTDPLTQNKFGIPPQIIVPLFLHPLISSIVSMPPMPQSYLGSGGKVPMKSFIPFASPRKPFKASADSLLNCGSNICATVSFFSNFSSSVNRLCKTFKLSGIEETRPAPPWQSLNESKNGLPGYGTTFPLPVGSRMVVPTMRSSKSGRFLGKNVVSFIPKGCQMFLDM